eukprot:2228514-Rhodomonas_salina.3
MSNWQPPLTFRQYKVTHRSIAIFHGCVFRVGAKDFKSAPRFEKCNRNRAQTLNNEIRSRQCTPFRGAKRAGQRSRAAAEVLPACTVGIDDWTRSSPNVESLISSG